MTTTILKNALLVLEDDVVSGWVAVADGLILEQGVGQPPEMGGIDCKGDLVIPGLVELHTDHLEAHYVPRPRVHWHPLAAVLAYDAQMAASGITTVFDSLRVGSDVDSRSLGPEVARLAAALALARRDGLLRAEHRLHLRCELCAGDVIASTDEITAQYPVDLMSLMDHTPGARQFRDVSQWKVYYGGKSGTPDDVLDAMIAERQRLFERNHDRHREALVALAQQRGIVLASHDDTTVEHVGQSVKDGISIAEFPTTLEAAEASHAAGISVLMGAPNVVRGGSHSGNIAAEQLALNGVLDILSSDYVPSSLLIGALDLARRVPRISLAHAIRTVTLNPARACGLDDRGAIRAGLKADLVRVQRHGDDALPVVREVYRDGVRII